MEAAVPSSTARAAATPAAASLCLDKVDRLSAAPHVVRHPTDGAVIVHELVVPLLTVPRPDRVRPQKPAHVPGRLDPVFLRNNHSVGLGRVELERSDAGRNDVHDLLLLLRMAHFAR